MLFGKWMNALPTVGAIAGLGGVCTVVWGFWYWATPKYWEVGYMPIQPSTGFNHQLHAGKLGIDCRYCHTKVEESPEANIPNVATCYGCHAENHVSSQLVADDKIKFIRTAYEANESIAWRRVHKLPDYVRNFPHNAHVRAGVSCFSCHGQITAMPEVVQRESLSMSWCLSCHRDTPKHPELHLVPQDKVTRLFDVEQHLASMKEEPGRGSPVFAGFSAKAVYESLKLNPPDNCGACHY
ncbi:MAG: cytochrome c3 family protein [Phycisphaerales bacterium]